MSENDKNVAYDEGEMTLNQIVGITGGHYQTVKKIIDKYVEEGMLSETVVYRKNRPFKAYYISNRVLAEIQIKLKNIKKNSAPLKMNVNDTMKLNEKASSNFNTTSINTVSENDTMKMIDNVKFYEVVKQNNDLENKVHMLEAQYKDLEVAKANEVTALKAEQTKTEAELYKTQADLKLITDKSNTMESAYAEQKLEVKKLQQVIKNKDIALIVLGAILLVLVTIVTVLFVVNRIG